MLFRSRLQATNHVASLTNLIDYPSPLDFVSARAECFTPIARHDRTAAKFVVAGDVVAFIVGNEPFAHGLVVY